MGEKSRNTGDDTTTVLPDWLVALNESGGVARSFEEGPVEPGDIRTLVGFLPGVSTCLVYVIDVDSVGLADVVAVHDDPSMATHNDLIVYPENSLRDLNIVLRLPLRATVPVEQLSDAAFDRVDTAARSAIELFEFGDVPVSTISVGTMTNGRNDPRWAFCDETKADFHVTVDASWRSFLSDVEDRGGLPEILQQFVETVDEPFTLEHLNSYITRSVETGQHPVDTQPNNTTIQIEGFDHGLDPLTTINEALDDYAERIDPRKPDISAIDSYLRQVHQQLEAAFNNAEFQGIKQHLSATATRTGLNRDQVWTGIIKPQSPRIADDARVLYQLVDARVYDQCASADSTTRVSSENGWWETRTYVGVIDAT